MCANMRVSLLQASGTRGDELEAAGMAAFTMQTQAAEAVGFYGGKHDFDGMSEAIFDAFVAQLMREGRTAAAAKRMALYFGEAGHKARESLKRQGESLKNEL